MVQERLYRALLFLYPNEHRREYGEPMVQLFRDRLRREGGGIRTLTLCVQMMFDLACSAARERREALTMESSQVKGMAVRSGGFLLWSTAVMIALYMSMTAVVLSVGLVSLTTGWYHFNIESGPLTFLGYTMILDGEAGMVVSHEFSLIVIFPFYAASALLTGFGSVTRSLRTS